RLGFRRRFRVNLAGLSPSGNFSGPARGMKRRDGACNPGPQSAFFVAQGPPAAHRTRQVFAAALAFGAGASGMAAGAVAGLGAGNGTSSAVGSIMLPTPN